MVEPRLVKQAVASLRLPHSWFLGSYRRKAMCAAIVMSLPFVVNFLPPVLLSPATRSGRGSISRWERAMARILLTTRCRDSGLYDYFRENAPRNFRWRFGMPRRISFGLRFLRQTFPVF